MKRCLLLAVIVALCGPAWAIAAEPSATKSRSKNSVSLVQTPFGKTPAGETVTLTTCTNAHGLVLKLIDYGATVVAVETPDRNGKLANVNVGLSTCEDYLKHQAHFGVTVGRYANRIAKGRFTLDGKTYQLATNNGPNHLHGGPTGFAKRMWKGEPVESGDAVGVKFTYQSKDGEENYPGNLDATVIYTLTNDDELKIDYTAKTDAPTIVNLTNHCYWNLAGAGSGDVLGQEMQIFADQFLPVDATAIPQGAPAAVAGTVMDFTKSHAIGQHIAETNNGSGAPKGYDHCYVLRSQDGSLAVAARAKDPKSGRVMQILTTEPGIQFYTGNFLNGDPINGGYRQHAAFCLEAQHYPDSPNRPEYPSTVLRPGQTYRQVTVHKFSVE